MSVVIHEREQDDRDVERYTKRAKLDDEVSFVGSTGSTSPQVLPPSHSLLGLPPPVIQQGQPLNFHEPDVGISEYIGRGDAKIEGIIKQRLVSSQNPIII
jgi:tRNA pseudouridine13 synthase